MSPTFDLRPAAIKVPFSFGNSPTPRVPRLKKAAGEWRGRTRRQLRYQRIDPQTEDQTQSPGLPRRVPGPSAIRLLRPRPHNVM